MRVSERDPVLTEKETGLQSDRILESTQDQKVEIRATHEID